MTLPQHKNWAHHWKLKDGKSLDFILLPAITATETVHEFYNIMDNKKMTIECRDNCSFCSASVEFSNHDMTKMAKQFRPKEYMIFNVFIADDTNNITDQEPIKMMRLPIQDFKKLEVASKYKVIRDGKKLDIQYLDDEYTFIRNFHEYIDVDDYVHRDSDESIQDQYAFILNSLRNN